ncbi:hemolysin [Fulvitalea axinellae]|uniref:Hemolysin n=1 Tax=Fulvitalea axinellae TaxID=1182444 RepID=A0AAU9CW85_9BACT|nr:hemolysin [Fulvitalea axinellae]
MAKTLLSAPLDREELANSITHGIGALLSIAGLGWLAIESHPIPDFWHSAALWIFGLSLVVLYSSSTIYHSLIDRKLKRTFQIVDHIAIYVLISGTYTPFAIIALNDRTAQIVTASLWALSAIGALFKIKYTGKYKVISTLSYLTMGWTALIFAGPLLEKISITGFIWLIGGGLAYTIGVIFFLWERLRYSHAIWHLFVLVGSGCHFYAVYRYVLPHAF